MPRFLIHPMTALAFIALLAASATSQAQSRDGNAFAVGVLLHDQGPVSDRWEEGLDLNLEYQFRPWRGAPWGWLQSSKPHIGLTLNDSSDTNVAYAGLAWPWVDRQSWSLEFSLGLAIHDGDLEGDPVRCELLEDCGFGSRFLFRVGFETLWHFSDDWSASFLYDHVSHAKLLDDVNEGIDNVGLRLIRRF